MLELDVWDQQIATNLDAGDLEVLIGEALEDDRAGRVSKRRSTKIVSIISLPSSRPRQPLEAGSIALCS